MKIHKISHAFGVDTIVYLFSPIDVFPTFSPPNIKTL